MGPTHRPGAADRPGSAQQTLSKSHPEGLALWARLRMLRIDRRAKKLLAQCISWILHLQPHVVCRQIQTQAKVVDILSGWLDSPRDRGACFDRPTTIELRNDCYHLKCRLAHRRAGVRGTQFH